MPGDTSSTRLNWAVLIALLLQFVFTTYRAGRLTRQVDDVESRVMGVNTTVTVELERHRIETERAIQRVEDHVQRVEDLVIAHLTAMEQHKAGHAR